MKRRRIKYLALALSLVLSLTLGIGCSLAQPKVETPPPSPPTTSNAPPIDSKWSIEVGKSQAPILPSIADVVAKVKPSVVAITTQVVTLDFFNRPLTTEGVGSGWIIREDGYIVTNNHVIAGAQRIMVTLDDGRTVPAKIVGADSLIDLAVLKIEATNLVAAAVGDSGKLRVGDWVVAIGNALGLGITAKEGIISQREVSMTVSREQTLYDLLETSAAINVGNSGGPLVNMAGEVIGITSTKIATAGVEGMGYAISSREATPIIQQLINTGYVVRPWLGVSLYTVDQFAVLQYDLAVDKGALIVTVASGSPADKAGLKPGDVIVRLNDKEITNTQELIRAIQSAKIEQRVEIIFWRGSAKDNTYATLAQSPPPS